jgi:hypothetical protein
VGTVWDGGVEMKRSSKTRHSLTVRDVLRKNRPLSPTDPIVKWLRRGIVVL